MSEPVGFEGANAVYLGDGKTVRDLQVFKDEQRVISCWQLTPEELEEVARTGVVWLSVWSHMITPMLVTGTCQVTMIEPDGTSRPSRAEPAGLVRSIDK